jgi:hypothetical protein
VFTELLPGSALMKSVTVFNEEARQVRSGCDGINDWRVITAQELPTTYVKGAGNGGPFHVIRAYNHSRRMPV